MKIKDSFHTYAGITIVFWSLAYVLTRLALRYFSAFPLGFLRYFFASITLVVFAVISGMRPPHAKDSKLFAASGAFGFFLYMIAFNKGCETVAASTASVIIATVPVITALLARFIYGEKLSSLKWAATAVEFSGVVVLTLMNRGFTLNRGIVWLLAAALSLGVYNVLQRRLTRIYSGLQTSSYSIFAGTALLSVFSPSAVKELGSAPPTALVLVGVLGVFSSAVAYAAWAEAFKKAKKSSSVSNYMFVTPFLTSLLGFLIVGEKPDAPTIAGGGIIMLGFFLFNFGGRIAATIKRKSCGN